ncbi:MAG TPA: bifunctional phosphoribosylaminoimidazolecarboxamide formyltransferase/IMP cyclohydrolase [Egibacteraceae bacterium]|nr:bifunctional phosphoribosylaminoimidazolecarboxamide formyltransferase/IMP cyclohydrolase [Egibacteraceae bacterium]
MTPSRTPVRRALLSVYDKTGIGELARSLVDAGAEVVSTGSTAQVIGDAGVAVTEVSQLTGFPEVLDGRVKTLHPSVHAAILADQGKPAHREALQQLGLAPIDLVVVNLYPFRATVADPEVDPATAVEMIDIGGPAMVRAAAKNHAHVGVVVDRSDYATVLDELVSGGLKATTRAALAAKAFAHTAAYDADVAAWFSRKEDFPAQYGPMYRRSQLLRYGENPHQAAAYYVERGEPWGLGSARQLHGKELSYNNLLDTDAAWLMAVDFEEPCVAIVKHTNPAGLAVAASPAEAYPAALAGDPISAFGGIVASNRPIDADTARQIVEVFTEVVAATGYSDEALDVLRTKKNLRVLEITRPVPPWGLRAARTISGGLLLQDADTVTGDPTTWTVPTRSKPDAATVVELTFAWRVAKHAKSNAIVLSRDRAAVGVGAGQMSRVDSVRIAVEKSGGRAKGAVLASDAFFPFRDAVDAAIAAGVSAIVQPGGSVRDDEVVAACDEGGVPMVLTGRRHFRH